MHKDERVEIRLSSKDKELFKRAQRISGDTSISSFLTRIVKREALTIISDSERILASAKDREVFFDAVFSSIEPNQSLVSAAKRYKASTKNK